MGSHEHNKLKKKTETGMALGQTDEPQRAGGSSGQEEISQRPDPGIAHPSAQLTVGAGGRWWEGKPGDASLLSAIKMHIEAALEADRVGPPQACHLG